MTATEYHERRPNAGAPPVVAPHAFVAAKTSGFVWQRIRSSEEPDTATKSARLEASRLGQNSRVRPKPTK